MEKQDLISYRNFCVLDCLYRGIDIPVFVIEDEASFNSIKSFFRRVKWINEDDKLTDKGIRARTRIQKKLALKKVYLNIYPDFTQLTSQNSADHIYLP